MRDYVGKTVFLAAIGFALGLLVGLGFLAFSGLQAYYARNGAGVLAVYMLASGLLGAINVGATMIYSLERWGILRCTLIHFCISMACLCAVGFPMGWFSPGVPVTRWMLGACVVVYFIIWLINYLLYRRRIRRINGALKRWKDAQGDE